jgi:hypothetical protein
MGIVLSAYSNEVLGTTPSVAPPTTIDLRLYLDAQTLTASVDDGALIGNWSNLAPTGGHYAAVDGTDARLIHGVLNSKSVVRTNATSLGPNSISTLSGSYNFGMVMVFKMRNTSNTTKFVTSGGGGGDGVYWSTGSGGRWLIQHGSATLVFSTTLSLFDDWCIVSWERFSTNQSRIRKDGVQLATGTTASNTYGFWIPGKANFINSTSIDLASVVVIGNPATGEVDAWENHFSLKYGIALVS